jgi:metal-dependent amidase/aminoacylase/carboxypeptidase family protein
MPQTAIDSILVGSEIVTTLQSIVSRRIGPFQSAALSIGSFDGVGASNVISDSIILRGTLRFIDNDVRDIALVEIERIVKGICLAYGASYECNLEQGYPVTVNDEKLLEFIFESLSTADIPEVREIVYGAIKEPSEDFSHYGHYRPACYFFVGARPEDKPDFPHHHPKFDISEKALLIAAKAIGTVVVDKLTENK